MSVDTEPSLPKPGSPVKRQEQTDPPRYKVVSVRLRAAEFEAFSEQAKALGLTGNMALRIAARRIGGFLEIDQDVRGQLESLLTAVGEISRDIRKLHTDYIESREVDLDCLVAQRVAFGEEFAQLDALLRSILNVSKRRSDGRRKLEEAMT